jgi:hypothetical protein
MNNFNPDLALVTRYLVEAWTNAVERAEDPVGSEERRLEAVQKLYVIYRDPATPGATKLCIRKFFFEAWDRILHASKSPEGIVDAVRWLVLGTQRRGPKTNLSRDFAIAVAVRERQIEGATWDEAINDVANQYYLSHDRVKNIASKHGKAARAQVAFRYEIRTHQAKTPKLRIRQKKHSRKIAQK